MSIVNQGMPCMYPLNTVLSTDGQTDFNLPLSHHQSQANGLKPRV